MCVFVADRDTYSQPLKSFRLDPRELHDRKMLVVEEVVTKFTQPMEDFALSTYRNLLSE